MNPIDAYGFIRLDNLLGSTTKMTQYVIRTEQAPAPVGPYNQAIAATGTFVFTAGQIALNPATGEMVGDGDVEKQTQQVMQNLEAVLKAAGANFANVIKTTVFLADLTDFAAMNAIYASYFEGGPAPARSCVQAARLPKDALVEIECIAVLNP
jgi:2-iminobutanoate/2-iminopropanoate deaminase